MHLVDLNPRDSHVTFMSSRDARPLYVLVADADRRRSDECLAAIGPRNVDVIVVRDGQEAMAILQRYGPPALLLIDLALPRGDGLAVIEALPASEREGAAIIAWSSRRDLREFAAHRLAGSRVRLFGDRVPLSILRSAIEAALSGGGAEPAEPEPSTAAEDVYETMAVLSKKAQQLCGTAGVAVYLKGPDGLFRTSLTWKSEAPLPHSPDYLPSVFDAILLTGEPLFRADLAAQPSTAPATGAVRGLAAVPIVDSHRTVAGAICVFDVKPLAFDSFIAGALKALGREGAPTAPAKPVAHDVAQDLGPAWGTPARIGLTPAPVHDRRSGDMAIARELARVRRDQRQLSVVLFDIGTPGQTVTEADLPTEALLTVTEALAKTVRGSDLAIHWEGDACLLVLPGLGAGEARIVAERVRAAMAAAARHRVPVAGGVAELLPDETFDAVAARAADRVRVARERGHNRVA